MPKSNPASAESGGPVRVWSEAGVTLCVSMDPHQFVKFSFGHERWSPSDSAEDIARTERQVYEFCERTVNKRVSKLAKLVRAVMEGDVE